jgi:alpha-tubulin suppressor-like RCC1 family protein
LLYFIFLKECGKVFSVGKNCLGCNCSGNGCKFQQIDYFKNMFITDIACGGYHCISLSNTGDVFGWGSCNDIFMNNVIVPVKIF